MASQSQIFQKHENKVEKKKYIIVYSGEFLNLPIFCFFRAGILVVQGWGLICL